jgi:hypothetical protein
MLGMGLSFIACDREQSFLMAPDVREWLPANHLAWFVLAAVEEMDVWDFCAAYRVDGRSRRAYEPAMMVALLLYAYARGIRSSRVIERACVEDVAFGWSPRSSALITRRSRASSSATRPRWAACSVRSCCCAALGAGEGWSSPGSVDTGWLGDGVGGWCSELDLVGGREPRSGETRTGVAQSAVFVVGG